MDIPTLDKIVLESLDFFQANSPAEFDVKNYKLPFVVGSGNAFNTGRILFSEQAAVFADESNFKPLIKAYRSVIEKGLLTQAVVISASGEKDSVWEVELANQYNLDTTLLTCKPKSSAAQLASQVIACRSIAEPYTYNTSTYLGMLLASTKELPSKIKGFITKIEFPQNFSKYQAYAFVLPDKYGSTAPMIIIKGEELFGPHLRIRAYPEGHARHAKFIHRWEKELVISLNPPNKYYGYPEHRWDIDLPSYISFAGVIALTYYICGRIQAVKPNYFVQNIKKYTNDYGPKAYGKDQVFEVIVPGN